ncbi:MAG: hypothetical protein WDO18_04655 [Acidobacteriota bacterium]
MLVVFVHGWGVRNPDYGSLPERFRKVFDADIADVWLSEYITFNDAVTMRDLAQAFERARRANFPDRPFACVTHSTGGPLLRLWHDRYRGPLTHLFMLAPPNHGSALAQLGKGRLSRLKSWFGGLEPGQRILDWLELGSEEAWELNKRWSTDDRLFTCVIAGATHHAAFYDHLNSYTGERCSDGVVRVASANPNYTSCSSPRTTANCACRHPNGASPQRSSSYPEPGTPASANRTSTKAPPAQHRC